MSSPAQAAAPADPCERAPAYIRAIAPYQPGKPISELAREMGLDEASIIKLASNENQLGLSPWARAAIEAALSELARYPDGFYLTKALARKHGVAMEGIVLGNGSNDVLEMVGGALMGYLAAIHFWWPKITGRMYPEWPARISGVLIFLRFNFTFFPQFVLGYLSMPRRYHVYPDEFQVLNVMSSAGATILGIGYLLPLTGFAAILPLSAKTRIHA